MLCLGIESRGRIIQSPISESVQSYYCAVVTCEVDITGNGTKEDSKGYLTPPVIVLAVTNIVLLISMTVLVCLRVKEGKYPTVEDHTNVDSANDQNQQMLDYTALDFKERRNKHS